MVKVWTFDIRQGNPCRLDLNQKFGLPLEYPGGVAIWKMVGTDKEAEQVADLLTNDPVNAKVVYRTETESPGGRFKGEF